MREIEKIKILAKSTIEEALSVIDAGGVKIALVVDNNNRLLGTLGDGDVRRGLLRKIKLEDTIENIYFKNPITANQGSSKESLLNLCSTNEVAQLPIVDKDMKVIDLFTLDEELLKKKHENQVVLMVGGLGERLRPLTENTPKPMLNVGGDPILKTIVKGFVDKGFTNIIMCLGYKANQIEDYFKDGSDFGANIKYIVEERRMGTAGALSLIKEKIDKPFFVMNGDLISNINYEQILDFHEKQNSKATMCVCEYDIQVPYGVVNLINEDIISIEEKPIHSFFINAGVYLLNPECINFIPTDEFYDMPSLFEKMILNGNKTISFPLKEYWLDIGRISDYKRANSEFKSIF
jgi:dTDP-glucose pyrophosphorylase